MGVIQTVVDGLQVEASTTGLKRSALDLFLMLLWAPSRSEVQKVFSCVTPQQGDGFASRSRHSFGSTVFLVDSHDDLVKKNVSESCFDACTLHILIVYQGISGEQCM